MSSTPATTIDIESPRAAEAFLALVNQTLRDGKPNLRKLAEEYQASTEGVPTRQYSRLKKWSAKYKWMDNIATATTEEAMRRRQEVENREAEIERLVSLEVLRRADFIRGMPIRDLLSMRESVRKREPRGTTSVNVTVSVEVRQQAERLADRLGITPEELLASAERVAAEEWEKV